MLHPCWNAEAWAVVRVEFTKALAVRSEIRRAGLVQRVRTARPRLRRRASRHHRDLDSIQVKEGMLRLGKGKRRNNFFASVLDFRLTTGAPSTGDHELAAHHIQVFVPGEKSGMKKVDRRPAWALGRAAVPTTMVKPAAAQTAAGIGTKDASPYPGVIVRTCGDAATPSLIPGFKTVSMRDVIMQPGSKTSGPPMMNPMVCHILEGEMRIEQDGKSWTAKKNYVWTCNKDTKEQAYNDSNAVAIMRITDLKG